MSRRWSIQSRLVVVALVLVGWALAGSVGAFTMAAFPATVVGVADGDTLTVLRDDRTTERVRLHGIDAPERGQPFSDRARQFTATLAAGQRVRVEPTDRDRHGRLVAELVLPDGRQLTHAVVEAGYAWWFRRFAPADTTLARLEAEARAARRGLWADRRPVPPWEWRAARRPQPFQPVAPDRYGG
jgi:endonuclease YncB( thermonuclease family)